MHGMNTTVEPHPGEKRPAALYEDEDPLVQAAGAQSLGLPSKKKKAKLDSAAQSFLTEIFALQDTFEDVEIDAPARKVTGFLLLSFVSPPAQLQNGLVALSLSSNSTFLFLYYFFLQVQRTRIQVINFFNSWKTSLS